MSNNKKESLNYLDDLNYLQSFTCAEKETSKNIFQSVKIIKILSAVRCAIVLTIGSKKV